MSGTFVNNYNINKRHSRRIENSFQVRAEQEHVDRYEQCEHTEGSSSDVEKQSFPFMATPSGNLKVIPQQVIYETKQLSIVAADPRRTKVTCKSDILRKNTSMLDEKVEPSSHGNLRGNGDDTGRSNHHVPRHLFRKMEMFSKLPPPPSQMFQQPDADTPSDETDIFFERGDRKHHTKMAPAHKHLQEMYLAKMGFHMEPLVDWNRVDLPPKTDLVKLLSQRISNYVNPDILVKIGNHEYRCHSLVLQCYSEYFADKSSPRMELPETSVTKAAFAYIYDWMIHLGRDSYTLLRRDNILEIFRASSFLQIKELELQCWAFIDNEELFSEDKAFMLYLSARSLAMVDIMEMMVPRVQRFFLTLVASKDFLELVFEEASVFLSSNFICVNCEMEVFMSAIRWLMADWEKRKIHLVDLMSCVRFGLIAPWQLVDIRRNQDNQEFLRVTRDPEVSNMIDDGMAYAIIKYWYGGGNSSEDYPNLIESFHLIEPKPRNWAGPNKINEQKKYKTYQEFLTDLSRYKQMHLLSNKGNGDRGGSDSSESLRSELEQARRNNNAATFQHHDLIMPHHR